MIIFTPNTVIKSADVNLNFTDSLDITKQNNPYKFYAYRSTAWTAGSGLIGLNAELYDTNNNFDSTTNYRYDVPVTGYYQISFGAGCAVTAGTGYYCHVTKNGSTVLNSSRTISAYTNPGGWFHGTGAGLLYLVAGDYIQLYFSGNSQAGNYGASLTFMSGYLVSTT